MIKVKKSLFVNNKDMLIGKNRREKADIEYGLEQLRENKLIDNLKDDNDRFRITSLGYEIADKIDIKP